MPEQKAIGFICPTCFWEIDVFTTEASERSDCNHGMTLIEARQNFKEYGACEKSMCAYVRPPKETEKFE